MAQTRRAPTTAKLRHLVNYPSIPVIPTEVSTEARTYGVDAESQVGGRISCKDVATTPADHSDRACQTNYASVPNRTDRRRLKSLAIFLRSVEEMVLERLQLNLVSLAEKSFDVEWKSSSVKAELVSRLDKNSFSEPLCLDVQWNCTGTLLAGAFAKTDHTSICFHENGGILAWKLTKITSNITPPDLTIPTSTCISAMRFHPRRPSFLAAAGSNGEIFLWDLLTSSGILLGDSGLKSPGGHTEPITCLCWITMDAVKKNFMMLSGSSDGRLVIWTSSHPPTTSGKSDHHRSLLVPSRYSVVHHNGLGQLQQKSVPAADTPVGITCLSTNPLDDKAPYIIGTDTGSISSSSQKRFREIKSTINERIRFFLGPEGAVILTYEPHNGPVTAIALSPFSEKCFATGSTDGTIKIFHTTTVKPIVRTVIDGKATCCEWSPSRPFVLAVGSSTGSVLIFDFMNQQGVEPVSKIQTSDIGMKVEALSFNKNDREYLAVGNSQGVQIWRLPEILSTEKPNEREGFQDFLHLK